MPSSKANCDGRRQNTERKRKRKLGKAQQQDTIEPPKKRTRRRRTQATPRTSTTCATTTNTHKHKEKDYSARIIVGTSGYSYAHWHEQGSFYPKGFKSKQFEYYSQQFNSVELNATFYRNFKDSTWQKWKCKAAQARFVYVVKANLFFTHWKRLKVDDTFKH